MELRKDRTKWKLWEKLLEENDIGDPVKYFLYPKSSGNRIRQVYHLKKYYDYSKINFLIINLFYAIKYYHGFRGIAQSRKI